HVEQDQVERAGRTSFNGRVAVAGHLGVVSLAPQVVVQRQRDARFVFDNEDPAHDATAGRTIVNVLPRPGSLSSSRRPPWAFTISSAMVNPMPVPLTLSARDAAPRV